MSDQREGSAGNLPVRELGGGCILPAQDPCGGQRQEAGRGDAPFAPEECDSRDWMPQGNLRGTFGVRA